MPAHQLFVRHANIVFGGTFLELEKGIEIRFGYSYRHYEYTLYR